MRNRRREQRALLLVFAVGVVTGTLLGPLVAAARASSVDGAYRELRVFGQVLSYIQNSYVDDVDEVELIHDAVTGMLSDLDPHTTFMRPVEYQKLKEDTAGEFGGLGITVATKGDNVLVEDVVPDGPAAHAGIVVGDEIVAIDGALVAGLELQAAVKLLRGVPGTRVVVRVTRSGWPAPRDLPLVRRQVRVRSVDAELLDDGVGYVRIRVFQERTDDEVASALATLRRERKSGGGSELTGLVIDLRDNPGGLFDEGVRVADRFLEDGEIVRTEGRDPRNAEIERAVAPGTEPDYPIAVVVNGGTASASEILAGALQDHHRAVIVGTRTYGKGSVQTLFGLDDGSGLKLTVARYFTPSGRSIQSTGILPEVVVRGGELVVGDAKGDPQVAEAVRALKARGRTLARPTGRPSGR